MKKLILVAFFLIAGFISAKSEVKRVDYIEDSKIIEVVSKGNENDKIRFIECKIVQKDCYYRECTLTQETGPNGDVYTEKTCTPWVKIPCENGNQSGPLTGL